MKTFCIIAAIFAFASVATARRNEDWIKFEKFMKKYNKKYSSKHEELKRFVIFKSNLRLIDARNRDGTIGKHDVNMFTDLEKSEFLGMYTGRASTNTTAATGDDPVFAGACPLSTKYKKSKGNPATVDYRGKAVTPVKNQGQCGSCWAESATEQIETDNFFATGDLVELSPQQVTSCDTTCGGCQGGWTENAYDYVVKSGGIEANKVYPYLSGNSQQTGQCKFKKSKVVVKISSCNQISYYDNEEFAMANDTKTLGRENVMATAIATTPMSICVDATAFQTYSSGILGASCGTSINHCVQIVGAGTEGKTPYWIVRNSWGTSWGEDGYCRVKYGINACGIASDATTTNIAK